MYAFLLSTAVIFVAELGDKSQLMAMTFAFLSLLLILSLGMILLIRRIGERRIPG